MNAALDLFHRHEQEVGDLSAEWTFPLNDECRSLYFALVERQRLDLRALNRGDRTFYSLVNNLAIATHTFNEMRQAGISPALARLPITCADVELKGLLGGLYE